MDRSDGHRVLYRQKDFPLFQNRVYDTVEEARNCAKSDIVLVEDRESGLVRNAAFDESLMDYDGRYNNEQSLSDSFQQHMLAVADLIEGTMGRRDLVEVGCGKGTFLEMLLARGTEVVGYDPTYENSNPKVRKEYFSEELGIRGEGLILRHVLEHIEDPVGFLFRLADANGGRGLIYIEVPCFDWICDHRAWLDIFYEHVNYFRLSDFHRIFGRLVHADRGFGGQYLRIVGDLATLRRPVRDERDAVRFPEDFSARLAAETAAEIGQCIVWGAGSKGVIFSLLCERAARPVDRVIDINPAKQGKHLPATGLKVLSPEEGLAGLAKGSVIHVMNPNYLAEIAEMAGPDYLCKGMSHD